MAWYDEVVRDMHPNKRPKTFYELAKSLANQQVWSESMAVVERTLQCDPEMFDAVMLKGYLLQMQNQFEAAIAWYQQARSGKWTDFQQEILSLDEVGALILMGEPLKALALLEAKIGATTYEKSLYARGYLYVGSGDWPNGWLYMRHRPTRVSELPIALTIEELADKTLFLFHEQGYGDSLQFLRYAKVLRPLVKHLVIGVPSALKTLTERLDIDGTFEVVSDVDAPAIAACDISLPMLDPPTLLRTTVDTIPPPAKFTGMIRTPLLSVERIGLVWAGNSREHDPQANLIDQQRSMSFETMAPLLKIPGYKFVSLMLGAVDDDRLEQPLGDGATFLDTAQVICGLDLVVTIDSSVAHLAASLGVSVWLLSRKGGCWRWFWDDSTVSPWYPSMRIFRQKQFGEWGEVIRRVGMTLTYLGIK